MTSRRFIEAVRLIVLGTMGLAIGAAIQGQAHAIEPLDAMSGLRPHLSPTPSRSDRTQTSTHTTRSRERSCRGTTSRSMTCIASYGNTAQRSGVTVPTSTKPAFASSPKPWRKRVGHRID